MIGTLFNLVILAFAVWVMATAGIDRVSVGVAPPTTPTPALVQPLIHPGSQ